MTELARTSLAAFLAICSVIAGLAGPASAQDESVAENRELAKELANPLASLISIPFQMNYDRGIGPLDDGDRLTTNVQPVIPFELDSNWNLISRTIVPITYQHDVFPGAGSQFGLGDITAKFFLSPSRPTSGGFLWGFGPIVTLPTAKDKLLGSEKWGAGPTGVALIQRGPWTTGALANHVWSFAGDDDRADVNRSFVQPFVAYTTPSAWTFSIQSESTYDWTGNDWSIPVNVGVSKVVRLGLLPLSLQAGAGYWATAPDAGPEGFRARFQITFLLPK